MSGIGEDGDVHLFRADDRDHAEEVAENMREDLDEVGLAATRVFANGVGSLW